MFSFQSMYIFAKRKPSAILLIIAGEYDILKTVESFKQKDKRYNKYTELMLILITYS